MILLMDLTGAIVNLQQAELTSRVQYAVARKVLDQQKQQGSAAIKLIEAATRTPAKAGDQLLAAAMGLGGSLDIQG